MRLNLFNIKRNDRVLPFSTNNIQPKYECLICLEELINPFKLNCCNAKYHEKCIYEWINYSKTKKCLHCQKKLNEIERNMILKYYNKKNKKNKLLSRLKKIFL